MQQHKRVQNKVCKKGLIEFPKNGIRVDCLNEDVVIEIECSGRICEAVDRLMKFPALKKKLIVPNQDINKAINNVRNKCKVSEKILIDNLSGTNPQFISGEKG